MCPPAGCRVREQQRTQLSYALRQSGPALTEGSIVDGGSNSAGTRLFSEAHLQVGREGGS